MGLSPLRRWSEMTPADVIAPRGAAWEPWPARSRAKVAFFLGERPAVERAARRLFERSLDPWEYAGLAGAPDGARVEVGASHGTLYLEMGDDRTAAYRAYYYVRRVDGRPVLINDGFHIVIRHLQGRGLGWRVLLRQVQNASALDVYRIETVAGRRRDENGYYTWPRLGFDAVLPARLRSLLPPDLNHAQTVLDLMDVERGRRWWRMRGATIRVAFDLASNSRSRATLDRYVSEKKNGPKNGLEKRETLSYAFAR